MAPATVTADGRPTAQADSQPADRVDGRPRDRRIGHRLLALVGGRVTRHTLIYVIGMLAVGPFSVLSVMVLTRLLVPAQYGDLAVLMFFAGYLTTLYNTGSLHGTFMLVYGVSEGEGDDVDTGGALASAPRRALGTGVVLTLLIVTAGTLVFFAIAPSLSQMLLHRSSGAALVRWAAVSAAAGSLWRLTINVFRMERQPGRFAIFNATRPLFVVAGVIPLVLLGFGIQGALAGTALGTLAATALCIAMAHNSYALAFSWSDAKEIVRRGRMVVIPVLCLYGIHNGDIALLSLFAPAHVLGIYRVASRFASVPSYFASSFLMAWAPLDKGVLFKTTYWHVGEERVRGSFLTYYLLIALTIVVLLDAFSGVLVLLAGPAYRSAAPLIPLIGLAFVCYGLYIVLVRMVKVKNRIFWYALGTIIAGAIDIAVSLVTIPRLGAYGAPIATMAGLLVACVMWTTVVTRLMGGTFTFEARPLSRLAAAVVTAGAVQWAGLSVWPAGRPFVLLLVLVVYVAMVAALGVIPRRHIGLLSRLVRAAGRENMGGQDPTIGLARLDARRRSLLAALERDGVPPVVLAERLGISDEDVCREYMAVLRELIDAGQVPAELAELDVPLAGYLLSRQPEAHRDRTANELIEEGADGLELMELGEAVRRLRALPSQAWTTLVVEAPNRKHTVRLSALTEHLADLPAAHRRAALAVLRDGRTPAQAAAETGISEHLTAARVVRVLRVVGGLGKGGPNDAHIGMTLFGPPTAGARPPEARSVALIYNQVRAYRRWRWRRSGMGEVL
jgi:O-antigen/teichoic acid export membrane protein